MLIPPQQFVSTAKKSEKVIFKPHPKQALTVKHQPSPAPLYLTPPDFSSDIDLPVPSNHPVGGVILSHLVCDIRTSMSEAVDSHQENPSVLKNLGTPQVI